MCIRDSDTPVTEVFIAPGKVEGSSDDDDDDDGDGDDDDGVTAVTEAFMAPGKVEGSSGTRNLQDNLSDLKAQVAANQKVIQCNPAQRSAAQSKYSTIKGGQ